MVKIGDLIKGLQEIYLFLNCEGEELAADRGWLLAVSRERGGISRGEGIAFYWAKVRGA